MIIADTNLLVYLTVPGEHTAAAEAAHRRDVGWAAPQLWRSDFRNVLGGYLRRGLITRSEALGAYAHARCRLTGGEIELDTELVLGLMEVSRCSSYDCEFVAAALTMKVPLVTANDRILHEFPEAAVSIEAFGRAIDGG